MYSLSEAILNGRLEEVEHLIEQGAPINLIDKYGFTPLIQSAICNDYAKAALLLDHGAEVDSFDVTGADALHWAVDNQNIDLVRLLLERGANPNGYSHAGQPVLIKPLLRHDHDMIALLKAQGAKQDFAQDYINTKLIGHRFELVGTTDIVDTTGMFIEVSFEGFYLEFTLSIILESLVRFMQSYAAHRIELDVAEINEVIETIRVACRLRSWHHYNINATQHQAEIDALIQRDLLLLPISFEGHAITIARYQDYMAKCDRAARDMDRPIVVTRMARPAAFDYDLCHRLLYEKGKETVAFIKSGLGRALQLSPVIKLGIKHQVTGNCSWANMEAAVPCMLFMLLKARFPQQPHKRIGQRVMAFYRAWRSWDKDRALEDCYRDFEAAGHQRRASKVALMGAVFCQGLDPTQAADVARAKKLLPYLRLPPYRYVLRSYINIYIKAHRTAEGARLQALLKACGSRYQDF